MQVIVPTIIALVCAGPLHAFQARVQDDEVLMRLSLKPNAIVRYAINSVLEQDVEAGGGASTNAIVTDLNLSVSVTDVTLGRSTLKFVADEGGLRTRTKLDERMPLMDSVLRVKDGKGLAVLVTCDPTGRVLEIESGASDDQLAMLNGMRVFDRIVMQFPKERVRPGDRWISEMADTMPAPQGDGSIITTIELEETFSAVVDSMGIKCWLIEGESSSMKIRGGISVSGMNIDVSGGGTMRTRAMVDSRTGLPLRSELLLDNSMTLRAAGAGDEMAVPSNARMRVVISQRPKRQ
ncbi:MAG: hypothetical protein FGM32_07350 [Candidatus Kapabacteria bacterium]|nr:hypothetical protein [Candidatus Kapabacteria bacterium]